MKIIAPESLADVKWILQHWKTTKLRLPDRFEGWHYKPGMTEDEQMALVDLAITHQYPIPADFSCSFPDGNGLGWGKVFWKNGSGLGLDRRFRKFDGKFKLLAHVAADRCYPFPAHFTGWHLADANGWTVAHVAAAATFHTNTTDPACLPHDRAIWQLRTASGLDEGGDTVLHLRAALGGSIPECFPVEDWHLANAKGLTVIDLAREAGHTALVAQYEALAMDTEINYNSLSNAKFTRRSL